MSLIKSKEDLDNLRESGKRLASILAIVSKEVRPGVSTKFLDEMAERLIREGGDVPAFLNYTPEGAERPFPATLCVSVNNEVVHGVPSENDQVLKNGDIVSLDIGLSHKGLITDMAVTLPVGEIDDSAKKLLDITKFALEKAISVSNEGARVGDIGATIEKTIKGTNFQIVEELGGHGVGYKVHDAPYIPNFGDEGKGERLLKGMALALEPIINEGSGEVVLADDGYTYKTADGKRSAHFEHTIYIGEEGTEIITQA